MKEHIAKLHRLIAASQATMAEYSEMMKVVNEMIELEVKLTTERQSNEDHIKTFPYRWLKKYPTSDEFIIASNPYDNVKL
jgi:hypothetical protein